MADLPHSLGGPQTGAQALRVPRGLHWGSDRPLWTGSRPVRQGIEQHPGPYPPDASSTSHVPAQLRQRQTSPDVARCPPGVQSLPWLRPSGLPLAASRPRGWEGVSQGREAVGHGPHLCAEPESESQAGGLRPHRACRRTSFGTCDVLEICRPCFVRCYVKSWPPGFSRTAWRWAVQAPVAWGRAASAPGAGCDLRLASGLATP